MEPVFRAEVLTLFPRAVSVYLSESILGKAAEQGLIEVRVTDIRDYASGKHRITDDAPYGGGGGMVMKVEPIVGAIEDARTRLPKARVLLTSPRGAPFDQSMARELAQHPGGLVLVCGRYEGVDERVSRYVDGEISLGDFVITGGELAALAVIDAVSRLCPRVLGNETSTVTESFEGGLLEYPHYTRPREFRGAEVPEVLQSGDHARIDRWRRWHALMATRARRPEMFAALELSSADKRLLELSEEDL